MSLAEELLADLEEDGYDDGEPMVVQEETTHVLQDNALIPKQTGILLNILFTYNTEIIQFLNPIVDLKNAKIRDLAKLRDSERLVNIMRQIDIFQSKQRRSEEELGPVESDPEYILIVDANNLIVEIDDEICKIFENQIH